jgi:hypothetical protein
MDNFHNCSVNIPLTNKLYLLYKFTYSCLKNFPKKERYALGQKIENTILELLADTFYTNQLPNNLKENQILKLNSKNKTLKLLFRLAYEISAINFKQYLTAQDYLQQTGKMFGGWNKYLKSCR